MEQWLCSRVEEIFTDNPLSAMMDINITVLEEVEVALTMPVANEIHTNVYGLFTNANSFLLKHKGVILCGTR